MFDFINVKYKGIIDIPKMEIKEGRITTLVGESGAGKTTILRLMNKMLSPDEGQIVYNNTNLEEIDSILHRREVTMLSQNPIIFKGTIRDNLQVGLKFQNRPLSTDEKLNNIMKQVHLDKGLDVQADKLSGGERQRLALGRVLLLDSKVYLLDEPSSSLDDNTEELIIEMVVNYVKNNNKTLVMVTHSKTVANKNSDFVIQIIKNKRISEGKL